MRYQGQPIAVTTVTALHETHVIAASEARALGKVIRARLRGDLFG